MKHDAITAADAAQVPLTSEHIARLARVPLLTDMPTTVQRARDLEKEILFGGGHYGTLGRNGIAPAVDACMRSAVFHGFDWRERFGFPTPLNSRGERMLAAITPDLERVA